MVNSGAIVKDCKTSLNPPNPSQISNVEIKSYKILAEKALGQTFVLVHNLSIQWSAPSVPVANLSSLGYQVWVGASEEEGQEYDLLNITMLNEVNTLAIKLFCIYVSGLSSISSDPQEIPLENTLYII